jgi:toxin ParE1/3/4
MPLRLARRASGDLDGIYGYGLQHWGEAQAERYLQEFWRTADFIEAHPLAARERDETAVPVRVRRFGSHLVIYRAEPGGDVLVIRVVHARSDWIRELD